MSREGIIELACLYGPLLAATLLACWVRPDKRLGTGLLFSALWTAALLPWLDALSRQAGFWNYRTSSVHLGGMPLSLYLGWVIAWGVVAPLLGRAMGGRHWMATALLIMMDLRVMPELQPVLELGPNWWIAEIFMVLLLLLPSLWMAKWTAAGEMTGLRCAMLVPAFGGMVLGLPLFIEGGGIAGVHALWQGYGEAPRFLFTGGVVLASIPGLTAVRDLALSGGGTPVPLDPPRRLVTHGIYAFVRNPMQISMTSLLVIEAAFLRSPWPLAMGVMGVIYSEGMARWAENQDMADRFGGAWDRYRCSVRSWFPRWLPQVAEPCELWIAADCSACREVGGWFDRRNPVGLHRCSAAGWTGRPLERVMWRDPASGRRESGVAAIAMALQHVNLAWACLGWVAGLPGISHSLQMCFDAAGAGRRPAG